jgi:hypothetical protein
MIVRDANNNIVRRDSLPRCLPRVEVFADGNVKDVLGAAGTKADASDALGLHYTGGRYDVTGLVNVAGARDTILRGYGSSILIPAAGPALNAAALSIRGSIRDWTDRRCAQYAPPISCQIGFRLRADASTRLWASKTSRVAPPAGQTDSVDRVDETIEVPVWGLALDGSYSFFFGDIIMTDGARRPVEMILDVGVARRAIRGDIGSDSQVRKDLRRKLLGTEDRTFGGYQIGLTLIYHQIRSSLSYVRLTSDVDGLSGGQIVAALDLRAPLASGLLQRP